MKTSNEINELAAALSKAQSQFTPVLKKAKVFTTAAMQNSLNLLKWQSRI